MTERRPDKDGVLYFVVCAAPPAQYAHEFVVVAQKARWDVCVISTPQATQFINIPLLEELTGYPVRSQYKPLGTPDIFPPMDTMVVAPMTLNTTTKWAQGNADTLALSQLCKGLGLGLPIVAAPCVTSPFARHPAFSSSITLLRDYGVRVLFDPEHYPAPRIVPWDRILQEVNEVTHKLSE